VETVDPLIWQPVFIAGIAAVSAVLSSAMLSWLQGRNTRAERAQDYARQDQVAADLQKRQDEVAEKAAEAAELLATAQKASADKAAEAAALLLKSNEKVANTAAKTAQVTSDKLDVIHTLVNSNMTAAMQSELDARRIALAQMLEIVELKRGNKLEPTKEVLEAIGSLKGKINELEAQLKDRLSQSDAIAKNLEKKVTDSMMQPK